MSLHDYRCDVCGYTLRDHHVPTGQRASEHAPLCPQHQYPLGGVRMAWIPQARFSVFSDSGREAGDSFAKFTLPVEDPSSPTGFRDETVGSLADIRRLERESEQRERDGLGRRMIWRDYSQDHSNRDVHTLAPDPSMKPPKHYSNGTPVTLRRGAPVIADHGEQHEAPLHGPDTLAALEV